MLALSPQEQEQFILTLALTRRAARGLPKTLFLRKVIHEQAFDRRGVLPMVLRSRHTPTCGWGRHPRCRHRYITLGLGRTPAIAVLIPWDRLTTGFRPQVRRFSLHSEGCLQLETLAGPVLVRNVYPLTGVMQERSGWRDRVASCLPGRQVCPRQPVEANYPISVSQRITYFFPAPFHASHTSRPYN
jgi:hypothetical protein